MEVEVEEANYLVKAHLVVPQTPVVEAVVQVIYIILLAVVEADIPLLNWLNQ